MKAQRTSGIEDALDETAVEAICTWWKYQDSRNQLEYLKGFLHGMFMAGAFNTAEHVDAASDLLLLSDIVNSKRRLYHAY